jgi:NAD-dependent dihydropyrimidine dehydrogenase PreA subunit
MPKIIFNYNLCDMAPECGGIEVCPTGAIHFDEKTKRPVWDESKCTFCLACTTPDACPVGVIMYTRDEAEEKRIQELIGKDPRTADWLWQERYGVHPARVKPNAIILTKDNFDEAMKQPGYKIIDVWSEDTLDCRLHSPLYSELLKGIKKPVQIYKLDAGKYPRGGEKLKLKELPAMIVLKDSVELLRSLGYIQEEKIANLNKLLRNRVK